MRQALPARSSSWFYILNSTRSRFFFILIHLYKKSGSLRFLKENRQKGWTPQRFLAPSVRRRQAPLLDFGCARCPSALRGNTNSANESPEHWKREIIKGRPVSVRRYLSWVACATLKIALPWRSPLAKWSRKKRLTSGRDKPHAKFQP